VNASRTANALTAGMQGTLAMGASISTLAGSDLHKLCIDIYRRHCGAGNGRCAQCGNRIPCPPRQHAASVIVAAGEDPRSYDPQAWVDPPHAAPTRTNEGRRHDQPAEDTAMPTNVTGYHLGGMSRRTNLPYDEYKR
jgi:hypothetical protein